MFASNKHIEGSCVFFEVYWDSVKELTRPKPPSRRCHKTRLFSSANLAEILEVVYREYICFPLVICILCQCMSTWTAFGFSGIFLISDSVCSTFFLSWAYMGKEFERTLFYSIHCHPMSLSLLLQDCHPSLARGALGPKLLNIQFIGLFFWSCTTWYWTYSKSNTNYFPALLGW